MYSTTLLSYYNVCPHALLFLFLILFFVLSPNHNQYIFSSIDVPTIIQDDCKIDNNWLHQHFPTALGVSVMNNAGKWEDVDILGGLTSEVKKGTKIWITKDTGISNSDDQLRYSF